MAFLIGGKMKNKKGIIAVVCAALLALALFLVFRINQKPVVQGSKHVTVEVTDPDQKTKGYTTDTDAEYLVGVMDELKESSDFTYEGSESDYGLYITSINGITADYNTDGAYWAIYVNGEYGSYGADAQPVADGDTFTFAYEKG